MLEESMHSKVSSATYNRKTKRGGSRIRGFIKKLKLDLRCVAGEGGVYLAQRRAAAVRTTVLVDDPQ